jgi:nitrate reductase delta subunit
MKTYKGLSLLLDYPEPEWLAALDEIEEVLVEEAERNGSAAEMLAPLLTWLRTEPLVRLQENYVATFDRHPAHSLHLFEHLHGESRERGPALLDLQAEYARHGLTLCAKELPDYLPLFLEYLSLLPEAEAKALLGEAVHVLAHIGRRLALHQSPYARVFEVLARLSPLAAEPLRTPVRDMEQVLEAQGPAADGAEPLLVPHVAYLSPPRRRPPASR